MTSVGQGSSNSSVYTVLAGSGPSYEIRNPATAEVVGAVTSTARSELDEVVCRAAAAGSKWSRWSPEARAEVLKRCAAGVRAEGEAIAGLLTLEQGKPLKEAAIEVKRCADTFDYYAEHAIQAVMVTNRLVTGKRAWVTRRPIGTVAAIVPWNFPLTLLANKLVPALVTGNAVVVKPAPTTPLATDLLLRTLFECGLPNGLVGYIVGDSDIAGALVTHPGVDAVSFTGSTATGRKIMAAAAPTVKRLMLELGGSDPMIICDDADLDAAARSTAVGRFFNCGQACIAVKRAFVMASVMDEFLARLVPRVEKLELGDGRAPGVRIGPQHSDAERGRSLQMIEDAVARGAHVVTGGRVPDRDDLKNGHYLMPTLLRDVSEDALVMTEECFGPVLPVVAVDSLEEAIERANASVYGLGSSIWTRDPDRAATAIDRLAAGYTWVNDIATDYDGLPFGGVKQSGFGRERGTEVLDEYVTLKSVVVGDVQLALDPEAAA